METEVKDYEQYVKLTKNVSVRSIFSLRCLNNEESVVFLVSRSPRSIDNPYCIFNHTRKSEKGECLSWEPEDEFDI